MRKREYIAKLRAKLYGLPPREVEGRISFYSEMIDDRIEEGLSEEDAVLAVGSVEKIADQIREELKVSKGAPTKEKLRPWEIALIILGSPIWASLLIVALAVGFSLYVVMWALIVVMWAVELPFFIFEYISKYLFVGCKETTRVAFKFTGRSLEFVKNLFRFGGRVK